MKGIYCFAGHRVEIDSIFPRVHELCELYRSDGYPEYAVRTTRDDIDFERERSDAESRFEEREPPRCPDAYLETLAVYRKLAECLLNENILLFHGSAIAVDGIGYLFTAKSGTGKSTHTQLWREAFGTRAVMINDDKPFLEITGEGVTVWGTPWDGKHRLSRNISAPLKAVCILERGEQNCISPISVPEAWPMLLQQSNRPQEPDQLKKTIQLADALAHRVLLYRLYCNMSPDAARTAWAGMNEGARK